MSKPRYDNEKQLRNYISDIINYRNNKDVLAYIKTKLDNFSFSDEFIAWCKDICKQLQENIDKSNTNHNKNEEKTIIEPLPKIDFNLLSEDREREHFRITKQHISQKSTRLSENARKSDVALINLKDDLRYSTAEDKLDSAREYNRILSQKSILANVAQCASLATKDPYFGRLDFKTNSSERILYISKTNAPWYADNHHNVYYIDWRSPIADLYYRYLSPTESVTFKNSEGEVISGDIKLTARFQNENNILSITYSSSPNDESTSKAAEDILQEKLSSNSDEHMTEIVETI